MANMVIADLDAISVVNKGWSEQFKEAMNVNGGDVESAKMIDYIMHFFAFPWKVKNCFVLIKTIFKFFHVYFISRLPLLSFHHHTFGAVGSAFFVHCL